MSSFGNAQEAGEGYVNKLYTGVENFRVTHVCPNHDQLKTIYGDNAKEPQYKSTDENGVETVRLDFYLDNESEEGEPTIKTKVSYFIKKAPRTSQNTGKQVYINVYGQNTWLTPDGNIPENMSWFQEKGKRAAYTGEPEMIGFLRNLLNLPGLAKAKTPESAESYLTVEDWNKIFSGNFSVIRDIVASSPNKVGFLLGVKTAEGGKMYQDIYNRETLRQWAKANEDFDYLRDKVKDSQDNGAYPNTNFGNADYKLREYTEENTPTQDSVFNENAKPASSFFSEETASQFS